MDRPARAAGKRPAANWTLGHLSRPGRHAAAVYDVAPPTDAPHWRLYPASMGWLEKVWTALFESPVAWAERMVSRDLLEQGRDGVRRKR